ncbi:unnamed protein product [marine sediment metagenome]|uniref:Uncharacterized protein n=1 Tax=marine sediment metagenome TaxID=412755 RepID=X1JGQ4_9ZZZZ
MTKKEEKGKNPLILKYKAFIKGDEQEISFPLEIYSPSQRRKIVDKLLKNKFEI